MSIMECLILGLFSMNNDMNMLWIFTKFSKNKDLSNPSIYGMWMGIGEKLEFHKDQLKSKT